MSATNNHSNGSAPTLTMRHIEAGYYAHDLVLNDVSITALPNKVTVILGPNGSGKSTTLRILYGILQPRQGQVTLDEQDITPVPSHQRLELGIALLPQGRSTFPELTVHENLEVGGWVLRNDRQKLTEAVEAMYERYPILKDLRHRPAGGLSGGQQRIVEMARMMVSDPKILLIDEPSVGLAPVLVRNIYEEIAKLKDEQRTLLLVDQNIQAAVEMADYVYTLDYGRNHLEGDRNEFEGKLSSIVKEWLRF